MASAPVRNPPNRPHRRQTLGGQPTSWLPFMPPVVLNEKAAQGMTVKAAVSYLFASELEKGT